MLNETLLQETVDELLDISVYQVADAEYLKVFVLIHKLHLPSLDEVGYSPISQLVIGIVS